MRKGFLAAVQIRVLDAPTKSQGPKALLECHTLTIAYKETSDKSFSAEVRQGDNRETENLIYTVEVGQREMAVKTRALIEYYNNMGVLPCKFCPQTPLQA